jgi:RNase P subunit RPR2
MSIEKLMMRKLFDIAKKGCEECQSLDFNVSNSVIEHSSGHLPSMALICQNCGHRSFNEYAVINLKIDLEVWENELREKGDI